MLIYLYKGDGIIKDFNGGNTNPISISLEILPHLRTWHGGIALLGEVVPIIFGRELEPKQHQFVIRRSSIKIPAINYSLSGGKGYIYAEKTAGLPLQFQEWSINIIIAAGVNAEGLYSQDPPSFLYNDLQPWDCYSSVVPETPEYGQISPVIDLSSNGAYFQVKIPPEYKNGASLDLKVILQTAFEVV